MLKYFKENYQKRWFCLMLVITAAVFVMLPLPVIGVSRGVDLMQHLQFAATYRDAFLSGDLFPGWAAADNSGYGSIGIRFYPPVAYYLLALTNIISNDWFISLWTNAIVWSLLGSVGMYLWSRESLPRFESAVAAVIFSFAPYHRFQIYHLILFAEFAAMGVLPFCFYALSRLIRETSPRNVIVFGLCYATLILTHIPTTIVGSIGLGVYGVFLIRRNDYVRTLAGIAGGLMIGLLASSFHWLRLVSELNLVKHNSTLYAGEFYDYRQHLFPMTLKLKDVMPPLDIASIILMVSLAALIVVAVVDRKRSVDTLVGRTTAGVLAAGLLCVLMISAPSQIIWENVEFLQKIQFPWRWLSVGSALGALALAMALSRLLETTRSRPDKRLSVFGFASLAAVTYLFTLTIVPSIVLPKDEFDKAAANVRARKGCECWLPNTADGSALEQGSQAVIENREAKARKWEPEFREIQVSTGPRGELRIPTFYYPHWKATVNGRPEESKADSTGVLSITVPEGDATVILSFDEPSFLIGAQWISVGTWLIAVLSMLILHRRRTLLDEPNPSEIS
jgi:uncharacterized membrane protein